MQFFESIDGDVETVSSVANNTISTVGTAPLDFSVPFGAGPFKYVKARVTNANTDADDQTVSVFLYAVP